MATEISSAENEVWQSLKPVTGSMKLIGMSLDERHNFFLNRVLRIIMFIVATLLMASLYTYLVLLGMDLGGASVADFTSCLHIVGYGTMGYSKVITMNYQRPLVKKLVQQLVELWPERKGDKDADAIAEKSLSALRRGCHTYMFINIVGATFYVITPLSYYLYKMYYDISAEFPFIWLGVYPYDKTKPVFREMTYIFEAYSAYIAVGGMLSADLLFSTMSSHITLLLRLLQLQIRGLGMSSNSSPGSVDCYEDTIAVIKTHQKLISYSNEIEDLFSPLNLINVLLSSVNICCVVFNIVLLEPWNQISSKFFFAACLTEMGILCWYADSIYRASQEIADAVFESGWYKCNPRCRRAMLMLILRAQKPICFTALKFRNITLTTYSSILTNSYSYFTLLYTMYRE